MCVIIASLKGEEIKVDHLRTGFLNNPHGSGYMVAKDNRVVINKGFFKFEEFYNSYREHIGSPIVIHHRWATIGARNKDNCHPFLFLDQNENSKFMAGIAHNGHISGHTEITGASDTYNFVVKRLKPLSADTGGKQWWKNTGIKWFLEQAIGSNNKLVVLDNTGHIEIFNAHQGKWIKEDIWASNDSFESKRYRQEKTGHLWRGDEYDMIHANSNNNRVEHNSENNRVIHGFSGSTLAAAQAAATDENNNINDDPSSIYGISDEELEEIDTYLDHVNLVPQD